MKLIPKHYFACELADQLLAGWGFAQYSQQVIDLYAKR